jgi:hypothetical protein
MSNRLSDTADPRGCDESAVAMPQATFTGRTPSRHNRSTESQTMADPKDNTKDLLAGLRPPNLSSLRNETYLPPPHPLLSEAQANHASGFSQGS